MCLYLTHLEAGLDGAKAELCRTARWCLSSIFQGCVFCYFFPAHSHLYAGVRVTAQQIPLAGWVGEADLSKPACNQNTLSLRASHFSDVLKGI